MGWAIIRRLPLQVVILHHMLSKAVVKARPTVLWCYKKELGFSRYEIQQLRCESSAMVTCTLSLQPPEETDAAAAEKASKRFSGSQAR